MRIGTLEQKKATIPEENVKSVKKAPTKGKRISAEEIRAKVAANKSQTPEKLKLGEKMGLSRYEKEGNEIDTKTGTKNLERPSDVGLNDPNDPATRGKLKNLLSNGAVTFNERQRGVLEKILEHE